MTTDSEIKPKHQTITPYLIVKHAADFISFTEKVFGAIRTFITMRDEHTIMHAEITIGDSKIMLAEATETYLPNPTGFLIYVNNADDIYNKALNSGGTSLTPLANQSYGRSGGVMDPFGNTWWITSVNNLNEPANQKTYESSSH